MGTESIMLPLGTEAPKFKLKNVIDDECISLNKDKPLLIVFLSNHCPYVIHVRDAFRDIAHEYMEKGFQVVAINANSIETHPQDGPENMKKLALEKKWSFPFVFDEDQEIAKKYKAACTPDFYIFDKDHKLYYRGRMDKARPRNNELNTGEDLINALDSLLDGKSAPEEQFASLGCSIKWHPGKFPDYFG